MLKLENISKYYYSSSNVTCALRKINLEFKCGEFVAITGESGSGKTTLLNVISGLDSYEDGEMYYDEKPTSYFDAEDWETYRKEEIAFIFQHYNLIDSYSVLENVMLSYTIAGTSRKEAKEKAKEILKKVGLDKDIHKKAIKLSGGQKQRLSIARALAKETKVIVADEPTGNLDVENGKSILELLKRVSKNKLVIIVTHNLAQIEPFITRKVRLHDGEIVLDEKVSEIGKIEENKKEKVIEKNNWKRAFIFSMLNIVSQPKKSFLLLLLMFVTTLSTFVFLANFKANLDENKTKKLENSIFTNLDETRMLVRKNDSSIITSEILEEARIDKVLSIEKYDYITDINYYRPTDYKIKYGGGMIEDPSTGSFIFMDTSSILLTNHTHYMRSAYDLTEDDLQWGRLPSNDFEMVVYSDDESILDTVELVLFRNDRKWGDDTWYQYNVKIVGILKEPTEQTYFSENICEIMDLTSQTLYIKVAYLIKSSPYSTYYSKKEVMFNKIVVDPNIGDYDLSFSEGLKNQISKGVIDEIKNTTWINDKNSYTFGYRFNLEKSLSVSDEALGVSQEVFDYIYSSFKNKKQFALFVEDYAFIEDIRKELAEKDFDSLSCFKSSVTGYDTDKVINKYINLVVSVVGLLLINVFAVILGYTILKVKKNDYVIFKMVGMPNDLCKKINYLEILGYGILSSILMVTVVEIVKVTTGNRFILDILKYVKLYDYLIVLAIILITMLILGRTFGKFLTNKIKVTVLKEE